MSGIAKKLGSALPRHLLPTTQAVKRMITRFADEYGLVYFGYVSQRSDDHHIVRGLTVSTKHIDDHYCIGTYDNYDVVFVERRDSIQGKEHVWHIMEFDLKTDKDIPHTFIGSGTHGKGFHELLSTKYGNLVPTQLGLTRDYLERFKDNFKLYVSAEHAVTIETVITPEAAEIIATHFKGLVVEITDQALYLYSEKSHLTPELLEAMLKNGTWLARTIDINSRSL